ncbi:hypothetical protein N9933_03580, partial [bacterium]|nr:hypothetical protein [bacterium]
MEYRKTNKKQKVSMSTKNANNKQWYKDWIDLLDSQGVGYTVGYGGISEYKRKKVNYDLFNNILDLQDFEYVCQPYGSEVGELPAKMVNRDIVSGKIKSLLGMEMKRPFSWTIVATNSEATTRREKEEFGKIRDYVISQVMLPIRQEVEMKYQKNPEMSDDQKAEVNQQVEEETKAMTPMEVKKYMEREYQDPAEVLSSQLLEYLIRKCKVRDKFNDGFKHSLLTAEEIFYVGIFNGEPDLWVVNPIRFSCDKSPDTKYIEDGEWATCEYRMTPSEVIGHFTSELTDKQIDKIYEEYAEYKDNLIQETTFDFSDYNYEDTNTIRVLHCVWKSLRKIGFLNYIDEDETPQEKVVHETYKLNTKIGDVSIEWEWIVETYEGWKIGRETYIQMQPVPGQLKDIETIHQCKLPYCGALHDNMNSIPTSIMDRLKGFQYFYDIIIYRIELLIASDKGKKVLMNIGSVPTNSNIDLKKWQYFFESNSLMWYDTAEEGNKYLDATNVAKVIDLSLASNIDFYINLAEYVKKQAGESIGVTPQIEGQTGPREAVANTRQNIIQSSHILEPYFELHNNVKRNVLELLLETAKIAYSESKPKKLIYVLDDLSKQIINMDSGLLDGSTLGLFV